MASKDLTEILGLMLIVVIALGLTPNIIGSCTDAKYGLSETDKFTKSGAGTTKECTLDHGYIRADTDYVLITVLNITATPDLLYPDWTDYEFTNNGTYDVKAIITVTDLTANDEFNITISYSYLQPAVIVALLNLVPLFWIVLIIASLVVVVTKKLKMW